MAFVYDHLVAPKTITTVKDVPAQKFIESFARHMKRQGKFELPKWADNVKTGVTKELAPVNQDWLYIRAASLARRCYNRGGNGVGAYRKIYGSQKRRGVCTNHAGKASGKIIRYCMQQLEEMGVVEIDESNGGRRVTPEGQREMDTVAVQIKDEEEEDDE